ncbi:PREDICTED: rRNA-processing protein utp23 isoform X2 [Ipomoea nil]|uniref:rRNA-processing protein utp23 isoform X2 n=1 Tax=Ipomoea nil TaxID=35883 RepID=UPI000901115A|nr:PREDICTED: rRNA-processing protein utp23 isoform X2 [Ipomoea nil]
MPKASAIFFFLADVAVRYRLLPKTSPTNKMKVKKQKRHRKAVRFYAACFGFRAPYKILCDGTFVHHLVANQITPADTALVNVLGASVKLFTTRCAVEELKSPELKRVLGASYSESLDAARSLLTARCDHEKRRSTIDCITEVIGENNPEHFFVATQDADLRKKLQQIPGVPVIYALRNALFLERPSTSQQQFANAAEEARSHMTGREYKELNIMKKRKLSDGGAVDTSNASEEEEGHGLEVQNINTSVNRKRNRSDLKDKVQFKRKIAKNPNPLSVKKKKKKPTAESEKVNIFFK